MLLEEHVDEQESKASVEEPPKKKRKRKKATEVGAPLDRPTLDADGRERPKFLLRYPEDPALDALVRAFEAGNFRAVREGAPKLAERSERPEVRRAAEELLRRIEPDPLVKFLIGVTGFLFVALVIYVYYSRG